MKKDTSNRLLNAILIMMAISTILRFLIMNLELREVKEENEYLELRITYIETSRIEEFERHIANQDLYTKKLNFYRDEIDGLKKANQLLSDQIQIKNQDVEENES